MEIIKRKNGPRYREKVYFGHKTITKTFKRKTDADRWKAIMLSKKVNFEITGNLPIKETSFEIAAKEWLECSIKPSKAKKTFQVYEKTVQKKLLPYFKDTLLHEVNIHQCEKIIEKEAVLGMNPKTINRLITCLRQIFFYGIKHSYINVNPINKPLHFKPKERDFHFYSEVEIQSLLGKTTELEIYPIIFLAIHTGMRLGEILGLCWDKVNFHSNRIEISRTVYGIELKESTKGKRTRYFPLNGKIKDLFEKLRAKQKSPKFIFTKDGINPYNSNHFTQRYFYPATKVAQVRPLRFHDLRHSFASHFMMKGGNLFELQKLLGHKDIKETQIYAHLTPDHLSEASKIVDFGVSYSSSSPYLAHAEKTKEHSNLRDFKII